MNEQQHLRQRLAALEAQISRIGEEIEQRHDRNDYYGATVLRKEQRRALERAERIRAHLAREAT